MPHIIEVNAADRPISSVMVYEHGAEVVRKVSLDLEPGQSEMHISNLPTCMDPSSLRVDGTGNAGIFDVISQHDPAESPQLKKVQADLADRTRVLQVLRSQLTLLEGYSKAITAKDVKPTEYREYLREHGAHEAALRKEAAEVEKEITDFKLKIAALSALSWQNLAVKVTVVVLARCGGPAELMLKYLVTAAGWSPLYDLRATLPISGTGEHVVDLSSRAYIMQATGESWKDVVLSLSTSQPSKHMFPAELKTQHVRQAVPAQPQPLFPGPGHMAAPAPMRPSSPHMYGPPTQAGDYNPYAESTSSVSDGLEDDATDEIDATPIWPVAMTHATEKMRTMQAPPSMTMRSARAYHSAISATFNIEGLSNIPSDDSTHKVTIATLYLDAEMGWIAIPKLHPSPFIQCRLANTSPYVLLPGTCNVYLDGAYVGKSMIPFTASQEEFSISVGSNTGIRLSYPPVSKKTRSAKTGPFFKHKGVTATEYTQHIGIKNTPQTSVKLLVRDQVPVSESEKFRVVVTEPKMLGALSAAQDIQVSDKAIFRWSRKNGGSLASSVDEKLTREGRSPAAEGEVEWVVSLKPGERTQLVLAWEITAPEGEDWRLD